MRLKSFGKTVLNSIYESVRSSPISTVLEVLGLNKILSQLYWDIVYHLSSNERSYSIQNHRASFKIGNRNEFKRFDDDLVGERNLISDLLESLHNGDVFYDIGANVGTYTCFVTAKLSSKTVVAFEPEPKNVNRLRENVELNDVDAKIIEAALSNTNGTIDLALTGDESGEGKHSIATGDDTGTIEVKTAKADTIIDEWQLPKPTVVKIDVEGAEMSVLRGMKNTLQDSCRLVYIEVHPSKLEDYGDSPEEVHSILEESGFSVTIIEERGEEYFVRGKKESNFGEE